MWLTWLSQWDRLHWMRDNLPVESSNMLYQKYKQATEEGDRREKITQKYAWVWHLPEVNAMHCQCIDNLKSMLVHDWMAWPFMAETWKINHPKITYSANQLVEQCNDGVNIKYAFPAYRYTSISSLVELHITALVTAHMQMVLRRWNIHCPDNDWQCTTKRFN